MTEPTSWTLVKMPYAVRGQWATQALAAAAELGFDRTVIRSQSDGFLVPQEVHRYLYPSQYAEPDQAPTDLPPSDLEQPPADQSSLDDLTEAELEMLTAPDSKE